MKFFAFLSLFTVCLLVFTIQSGRHKQRPEAARTPSFLQDYKREIRSKFSRPENSNILFSFITGDKSGISPYTKKAFKKVNLSFLLSPSGIHFSCVLFFIFWVIKKIKHPRLKIIAKSSVLFLFLFFPSDSIKRLSVLRLLFQLKFLSKIKITPEQIFIITFILAFLKGDYNNSPIGFIYSFIFLGTFFSMKNFSRMTLIAGLFSTQLILGLFLGEKVSLLSIPFGMVGAFLFTMLFPILLIFLSTFWLFPINWVEPLIRSYVILIQQSAKILNGTFTSSSIFLIAAVWILFMKDKTAGKCAAFAALLLLHTNSAMTPVIFR